MLTKYLDESSKEHDELGLDEFFETFGGYDERPDQLAKEIAELDGEHWVLLTDLLTPDFVSRHTRFPDAEVLFGTGGFDTSSQAAFEAIAQDKLDSFIQSESSFGSWEDMLRAAGAAWARGKPNP